MSYLAMPRKSLQTMSSASLEATRYTAPHCIERLLKNLTSWLGMARRKRCSLGGTGEMQGLQ